MQQAIEDFPVAMVTPNAIIQRQLEFRDVTDDNEISVERMRFGAGLDITPLLKGLQDDVCQCPHWGYVLSETLNIRYTDGIEEAEKDGDLFYLPPRHTAPVDEETEFITLSPQHEHTNVLEHMANRMGV